MANEDKLFSFFLTERSQVSSPGLQGNSAPLSHSGNLILSVLILCHLWQQWSLQGDPTSITWELVMFSSDAGRVRLGNVLPLPGLSIKNLHTFSLWGRQHSGAESALVLSEWLISSLSSGQRVYFSDALVSPSVNGENSKLASQIVVRRKQVWKVLHTEQACVHAQSLSQVWFIATL